MEAFDVVVVGAGQAGLATAWNLQRAGLRFVVLERSARIGDVWRRRWDSLRLFTPARFDALPGLPFPGDPGSFPTKDEMADYLEGYARRFALPVRTSTSVERLYRRGDRYVIETTRGPIEAGQVVLAAASYQEPRLPAFSAELDPGIVQLHSSEYRRPDQLRAGPVLIVGAGNSGAELATELAGRHEVLLAGRDVGEVPFDMRSFWGRTLFAPLVLRFVFHHVLTLATPIGRRARPAMIRHGGPLIRARRKGLDALGVRRVARVEGVRDGQPVLADGSAVEVANVVWCTGFRPGLGWVDLPIFEEDGEPRQVDGAATDAPGVWFVGLHFQRAFSSSMIHGVARDAERVARRVAARAVARAAA